MKTNAIVRIVLWSLVILLLVGVLNAGIGERPFSLRQDWDREDPAAATHVPQKFTELSLPETAPAVPETAVPETTASETLETTEPTAAAEIPAPAAQAPAAAQEPFVPPIPQDAVINSTAVSFKGIQKISIDWLAGNLYILPTDENQIQITEASSTDEHPMVVKQRNDELSIAFWKEGFRTGIGFNQTLTKDLILYIPRSWICPELDIDAGAASVTLRNMEIREVEFEGGQGICDFVGCTISSVDIDTASGDISFTGSLKSLEFDAVSASFRGTLLDAPRSIDVDSVSGDLDLTLPAGTGFTVTTDAVSSDFTSDFETISRNGSHIHGDGTCRIEVDGVSGDVIIRKG